MLKRSRRGNSTRRQDRREKAGERRPERKGLADTKTLLLAEGFVCRNHPPLLLTVMRGFLLARLVNGRSLGNAFIVAAPGDNRALGKIQNALDSFPNLDVSSSVILGPDAEDIFATPDAEDKTTHLVCSLNKLIAYQAHEKLLPVAVRDALFQAHDPLPAALILFILPDRTDAFLEEMIVRNRGQSGGPVQVKKNLPKVLRSLHATQRLCGFLVVGVFGCRWPVPDHPGIFQRPGSGRFERGGGYGRLF